MGETVIICGASVCLQKQLSHRGRVTDRLPKDWSLELWTVWDSALSVRSQTSLSNEPVSVCVYV